MRAIRASGGQCPETDAEMTWFAQAGSMIRAVVTGAAFGIGRATAELFAREGDRASTTPSA
jgi:hypothetical protein